MKCSLQETHRGEVLFSNIDADGMGYGFIQPDTNTENDRALNVFFSSFSTQGLTTLARFDQVNYVLSKTRTNRGPNAHRVWLFKKACTAQHDDDDEGLITALVGVDDL